MNELYENLDKCCGCGACVSICPKNAILMHESLLGSVYPVINNELCIKCGLCKKVCNFKNKNHYSSNHKAYAAATKCNEILMGSTSGGIFTTIAKKFIEDGGYVSGAVYDEEYNVIHIVTRQKDDLIRMQGSKYVQSSTHEVYKKIKELLIKGKKVLFSGTPCQVDGLYGFLMKKYDNLITIDIVCHGVPSNKLFKDYLAFTNKHNYKIKEFKFRDKNSGWGKIGSITYSYNNKDITKKIHAGNSEYYYLFENSSSFRDSCYSCKYSSLRRPADITIGDFWGIDSVNYEFLKDKKLNLKKGISLIITNTDKGEKILENSSNFIFLYESTIKDVTQYNFNLNAPTVRPLQRSIISKLYEEDFNQLSQYISKGMGKEKMKFYIKKLVPLNMKGKIKKIIK